MTDKKPRKPKKEPIPFTSSILRLLVETLSLLRTHEAINEWKQRERTKELVRGLNHLDEARFQREVVDRKRQITLEPHNHPKPGYVKKKAGRPKKIIYHE